MPEKVEKWALKEVKDYQVQLPTKEELTNLRHYTKTNIERFSEDNGVFKAAFDGHLEIIRRYDEVISEKANKHSVTSAEARLIDKFTPMIQAHDKRIKENF